MDLLIYGMAEGAATIMAVSIPMLRALVIRDQKPKTPQLRSISLAYHREEQLPQTGSRESMIAADMSEHHSSSHGGSSVYGRELKPDGK